MQDSFQNWLIVLSPGLGMKISGDQVSYQRETGSNLKQDYTWLCLWRTNKLLEIRYRVYEILGEKLNYKQKHLLQWTKQDTHRESTVINAKMKHLLPSSEGLELRFLDGWDEVLVPLTHNLNVRICPLKKEILNELIIHYLNHDLKKNIDLFKPCSWASA